MRYGDGPVPIHICTPPVPYTGNLAPNHYDDDDEFTWSLAQLILAILALRAVSFIISLLDLTDDR